MTTQPHDWSERRADARRNHERVLAAAIEVFTELGLDATMPEIAARAGVGKATVYRSYPSKASLLRAIADLHITWLDEQLRAAAERADPYEGIEQFIKAVMTRLGADRLMVEVFGSLKSSGDSIIGDEQREDGEHADLLRALLKRAGEQGRIRSDVTELDFQVLVGGAARALISMDIRDPALWQRYARLALTALRP